MVEVEMHHGKWAAKKFRKGKTILFPSECAAVTTTCLSPVADVL
jgi:hypothetical protein